MIHAWSFSPGLSGGEKVVWKIHQVFLIVHGSIPTSEL